MSALQGGKENEMPISLTSRGREVFETVEVRDPSGQRRAVLGPLSSSTTMAEICARALGQFQLPAEVEWNLRCERSGRLMNGQQRLADLAGEDSTQTIMTLQPEASLG
jgi:hypothetical protein